MFVFVEWNRREDIQFSLKIAKKCVVLAINSLTVMGMRNESPTKAPSLANELNEWYSNWMADLTIFFESLEVLLSTCLDHQPLDHLIGNCAEGVSLECHRFNYFSLQLLSTARVDLI